MRQYSRRPAFYPARRPQSARSCQGSQRQQPAGRCSWPVRRQAKNIFWQVAGAVTLGTTAHFEGVVLGKTLVAVNTGASANGRLLAQTAVTLQMNAVTQPAP